MRSGTVLLALVAFAASEINNTDHYDLDVHALFTNTETLKSFLDCFTDKQPCNEVQESFKVTVADDIQQACANCSPARKYLARNFIAAIREKIPNDYTEFKNKYDPEDKYFTKLYRSLENIE